MFKRTRQANRGAAFIEYLFVINTVAIVSIVSIGYAGDATSKYLFQTGNTISIAQGGGTQGACPNEGVCYDPSLRKWWRKILGDQDEPVEHSEPSEHSEPDDYWFK